MKYLKYLVIGSAPYIKEWFTKYGKKVLKKGFKVVAINNAWAVCPDDVWWWIHSNDFYGIPHTVKPPKFLEREWQIAETPILEEPYYYDKAGSSGTMILNTLCAILNRTVSEGKKCIVALAGVDCVYTGKDDWFYGRGTPDPLRKGREWLIRELLRVGEFYQNEECELLNIGEQEESLLPYTKVKVKEL